MRVENILDQETKKISAGIPYKSLFYKAQITGRNIAKLSRCGSLKTKITGRNVVQNSKEVEVLNQNYRQRYCKILKRWKY